MSACCCSAGVCCLVLQRQQRQAWPASCQFQLCMQYCTHASMYISSHWLHVLVAATGSNTQRQLGFMCVALQQLRAAFNMRATRNHAIHGRRWNANPASLVSAHRSVLVRHAKPRPSIRFDAAIVGIDLGTTNSLVATFKDGKPVVLADEHGTTSTPSVVTYAKASCWRRALSHDSMCIMYPCNIC
jgi:hypothetical protein